jgi:uncharacterized protein YjbI with pentapeptide repeats
MKSTTTSGIQPPRIPRKLEIAKISDIPEMDFLLQQVLFENEDLSNRQLTAPLFEMVHLRNSTFLQCKIVNLRMFDIHLERCDLSGANWEKGRFRRAVFSGCRMLGANLMEANFEDVIFEDCKMDSAILSLSAFHAAHFEKCSLKRSSFEGADLTGVVFDECDLSKADLRNAKLAGADFRTSTINGLQTGAQELQGAIISPLQAVQVVSLLGIQVKDIDDPFI